MTKREFNRRWAVLWKKYNTLVSSEDVEDYYKELPCMKEEFNFLYKEDSKGVLYSIKSMKRMIALNRALRIIPFHYLGMFWED